MDLLGPIVLGLQAALSLHHLGWALAGMLVGVFCAPWPALGPVSVLALMVPFLSPLDPMSALMCLMGAYGGRQWWDSHGAIASAAPQPPSLDDGSAVCAGGVGPGRVGVKRRAVMWAARVGVTAGIGAVTMFWLALLSGPFLELAKGFGAAEYLAGMLLGLAGVVVLSAAPVLKSIGMLVMGMLVSQVGGDFLPEPLQATDVSGAASPGIHWLVVALGVFVLGDIAWQLADRHHTTMPDALGQDAASESAAPGLASWRARGRGAAAGALLGLLPGGLRLAAWWAGQRDGQGVGLGSEAGRSPQGAASAGSAAAWQAAIQVSVMPLLSLGVPTHAALTVMAALMMSQGLQPGPQLMTRHDGMVWGLVAGLWLVSVWMSAWRVAWPSGAWSWSRRKRDIGIEPVLLIVCCAGLYALRQDSRDVLLGAVLGLTGYGFHKLRCEPAPLLLGVVLGPTLEANLAEALRMAGGDTSAMLLRPGTAGLILAAVLLLVAAFLPSVRRQRERIFHKEG